MFGVIRAMTNDGPLAYFSITLNFNKEMLFSGYFPWPTQPFNLSAKQPLLASRFA